MNWPAVWLLFVHEMRMIVRSRRTLVTAILLPLVVTPLMIGGARWVQREREERVARTTFQYALTGPWTADARELIGRYAQAAEFQKFKVREVQVPDPSQALRSGAIHFEVRTLDVNEADKAGEELRAEAGAGAVSSQKVLMPEVTGVPALQVVYRASQEMSSLGAEQMLDLLQAARRNESYSEMVARGFPAHPEGILATTALNLATESQVAGSRLGRFITLVLVIWILAGGSVAAMDILAGEKERGTLETLITTAVGRVEIVTAKQLAICFVALAITVIQVSNAIVYVQLNLIELPQGFSLNLSPLNIVLLFVLFVPMAAALSGMLLTVSAYSGSYKEAQLHFMPLFLGSLVPALAAVLPGLRMRSLIAFIPVANVSVAAREVLMDRPDLPMIGVTVAVMSLIAAGLIRHSAGLLSREDMILRSQNDQAKLTGGETLFEKRVLQLFAVMWAVMFAVAANVPQLKSVRAQLLFNELGIFLACSLLMVWAYRLDLRAVLGVRRLRWPVWAAVLMAVPAAQVVAAAFFNIVNNVIPSPESTLREFSRQLTPAEIPLWQRYLLMAILPAVCEELAFRGLLLHGLRKRFHPVLRCLFIGLVFGIFHYTLFRIAPTALLGVILTFIAMITGSVLPGILFHAANNAFAIWMDSAGVSINRFDWSLYVTATAVFGLAMYTVRAYGRQRR